MAEALRQKPLHGRRILIVEDSGLLASGFEAILKDAGAEVVGPALRLEAAERLAEDETLSGALLDIRLDGDEAWSVARLLDRKGVPFVFLSGYLTENACQRNGADGRFSSSQQKARQSSAPWLNSSSHGFDRLSRRASAGPQPNVAGAAIMLEHAAAGL
jgi:CheY-like chemotaxis protein